MRDRLHSAFSLGEVLVAVVCLGLLLAPLLAYVSRTAGLGHLLAGQRGLRGGYSVCASAVVAGVDPHSAPAFRPGVNPCLEAGDGMAVEAVRGVSTEGGVRVDGWRSAGAHGRPGVAGLILAAGEALPPADVPSQSLPPLVMRPPLLSPPSGSVLRYAALQPTGGLRLTASSSEGGRVVISLQGLPGSAEGLGSAVTDLSVSRVASGQGGLAWVEYAGDLVPGASRRLLADGRAEWTIPDGASHRLIGPSEPVPFSYSLDLGQPLLVYQGASYAAGATVGIDYAALLGVRSGAVRARVEWPASLRVALGEAAALCLQGFQCRFQGLSGSADGDLGFCAAESALAVWADRSVLECVPFTGGACVASPASWSFLRLPLELPQPELATGSQGMPRAAGLVEFRASEFGTLGRVGRLSARGGGVLSTGASLQLEVLP